MVSARRGRSSHLEDGAFFLLLCIRSVLLESGPRYSSFLGNLAINAKIFCAVYDHVEKADLSKGYQNLK